MHTTTVIIGAGHAGLAMSRCLADRSIDHVVLERGEVANSWKTERWDSLQLLTPNWQSRLPGYRYTGADPDGYRTMAETIQFIEGYAAWCDAPVQTHTSVTSVRATDDGYAVTTNRGVWRCKTVVVATGACAFPAIPIAAGIPSSIAQLAPTQYKNPSQLAEGGVMVVGASASGAQIADELQRSGRQVTLAVGEHVRVPRVYRGRDIKWWMDACGVLDESYRVVDNVDRARGVASLQLAGYHDRRSIDLNSLSSLGVSIVGRLAGMRDGVAQFSGSLPNVCALADLKMNRLLDRIDEWVRETGLQGEIEAPRRFEATTLSESLPLGMDLVDGGIKTVVWATGFRPDYSWLEVPVLDRKGRIRHDGGVVEAPGLYQMGLPFLRRRKSSLIDGAAPDARDLSEHLEGYLAGASNPVDQRVLAVR